MFDRVYEILSAKLSTWADSLLDKVPNLIVAGIIIIFFHLLARAIKKSIKASFQKIGRRDVVANFLSKISYVLVMFMGVFIALQVLQLDKTLSSFLAGLGIAGVALGFAFQDILSNFISGIILIFRHPFKIKDIVKTCGVEGKVVEINMRTTLIESFDGQLVSIPNKEIFQNKIENFTALGKRRLTIEVGISYADDINKAKRVAKKAVASMKGLLNKDIGVYVKDLGASTVNLQVFFWIPYNQSNQAFFQARSDATQKIKEAFDKNKIDMPFDVMSLDFAPKGCTSLAQSLKTVKIKKK